MPKRDPSRGDAPASPLGRVSIADALIALGVIAFGVYLVYGAGQIRLLPSYARIGPRFFPYLTGFASLACGVLLLVAALRGQRGVPDVSEDIDLSRRDNLRPVVVIAAALALGTLAMERAGFVVASTLIFLGVALAFGSRRLLRDAAAALLLALAAYLAFTRLLDLTLPAGILPFAAMLVGG